MSKKLGITEAKQRIGRFCAFRERSPKEVEDKLKGWGLNTIEINAITQALKDQQFIDEQRFANAFCHDKFEFNSWGKIKIRSYIFAHRLPSHVVDKALDQIDDKKYLERLDYLTEKKWRSLHETDLLKRKQKTVSYLSSKGFEPELVWQSVEKLVPQ